MKGWPTVVESQFGKSILESPLERAILCEETSALCIQVITRQPLESRVVYSYPKGFYTCSLVQPVAWYHGIESHPLRKVE